MGTFYSVKFQATTPDGKTLTLADVRAGIEKVLSEVNRQMSTYDPASELSKFNAYDGSDWFPVSSDLETVVRASIGYCEASNGAFDITVGPLVNLWGFGPEAKEAQEPDRALIKEAMSHVGCSLVSARQSPPAIKKKDAAIYIDLSAVAKGFGVDRVALYLETLGVNDYLVEIGGEIRASGRNHMGELWRVGITAADGTNKIGKITSISDASMATSGDYRNYYEVDGKRYSHTIDPRSGRPVTHTLAAVTVIDGSSMRADAMATALMVLGVEEGMELAQRSKLAVLFFVKDGTGFIEKSTPAFKKYLR